MKHVQAPRHLSKEARRIWRDILMGYDFNGDVAGLRILQASLEAYDRAQAARAEIDRAGMTVAGRDGQLKPHPLIPAERDNRHAFIAGLRALNLAHPLEPLRPGPGRPPGG